MFVAYNRNAGLKYYNLFVSKNLKVAFITSQGSPVQYYPFSAIPSNLDL